jgi:hypothetical protein
MIWQCRGCSLEPPFLYSLMKEVENSELNLKYKFRRVKEMRGYMRIMNLKNSNKKKVRGVKRKCNSMIKSINELTENFPEMDLNKGYHHFHLPVAQEFIDSSKTPQYVTKLCNLILKQELWCAFNFLIYGILKL